MLNVIEKPELTFEISHRNESVTHKQNDSYMSVAPGLKIIG